MGCRQQHRVDGVIGKHGVEMIVELKTMFGAEVRCALDIRFDGADDLQPVMIAGGLHQIAAPAAEADNRC